jgi:farnesyl-diphosphate farnesyltransferase
VTRSAATGSPTATELLRDVLPGVSRSFALSLRVLPASLGLPLGVTYLVARAADTVADTRALPASQRLDGLHALRQALEAGAGAPAALLGSGDAAVGADPAARLPDVLRCVSRARSRGSEPGARRL